MLLYMRVDIS